MKFRIFIVYILIAISSKLHSQNFIFQGGEIWVQETVSFRKGNGIFHTDFAARSFDWFKYWYRYHLRVGGGYRINDNWSVLGMGGYFYTYSTFDDVHDLRVNFDAKYKQNIFNSRVVLNYRLRQEYRYIFGIQNLEHSLRMRNRIGILVPINHSTIQKNTWYYKFDNEIFFELLEMNPNFLSNNRVISTFGWALNNSYFFEIAYCLEMDIVLDDDLVFLNHVLWFRFKQNLFLNKESKKNKVPEIR